MRRELVEGIVYPGKIKTLDAELFQGLQNFIRFHNRVHQEIDHVSWETFFGERRDAEYLERSRNTLSEVFGGASIEAVVNFLRGILPEKRGRAGRASVSR